MPHGPAGISMTHIPGLVCRIKVEGVLPINAEGPESISEFSLTILRCYVDLQSVIICKKHTTISLSTLYRTITPIRIQSFSAHLQIYILSSLARCFLHIGYHVPQGWVNIQLFYADTSTAPFRHVLCSSSFLFTVSIFAFCLTLTLGLE